MKIQSISQRQVSFRDDNTYIPPTYTSGDAISKLSERGYVIQGNTNADAFNRLHDDINADLRMTANSPSGVWYHDWVEGRRFNDRSVKYVVRKWTMPKENFTRLLTRFWEVNKHNPFRNIEDSITNYLVNYEGLKKPSFFGKLFSSFTPSEYSLKESILNVVTNLFLKKGQHRLK